MELALQITILVIVVGLAFSAGLYYEHHSIPASRARFVAEWANRTVLSKNGSSPGFGDYSLRSYDGGINWYAIKPVSDGSVQILGPVDEIHPGLLDRIAGFERLAEYALQHGPIMLNENMSATDRATLEGAGMKIVERPAPE